MVLELGWMILSLTIITILLSFRNLYVVLGLKSLEWKNIPPNWVGSDPCGASWEGIDCSKSRVTSM